MQRYNVGHRDRAQRKVKGHRLTTSRGAQRVDVVVGGTGTRTRVVLRCVLCQRTSLVAGDEAFLCCEHRRCQRQKDVKVGENSFKP